MPGIFAAEYPLPFAHLHWNLQWPNLNRVCVFARVHVESSSSCLTSASSDPRAPRAERSRPGTLSPAQCSGAGEGRRSRSPPGAPGSRLRSGPRAPAAAAPGRALARAAGRGNSPALERRGAARSGPSAPSRACRPGQEPSGPWGCPATGDPGPAQPRGDRGRAPPSALAGGLSQKVPDYGKGQTPIEGKDLVPGGREDRGGKPQTRILNYRLKTHKP